MMSQHITTADVGELRRASHVLRTFGESSGDTGPGGSRCIMQALADVQGVDHWGRARIPKMLGDVMSAICYATNAPVWSYEVNNDVCAKINDYVVACRQSKHAPGAMADYWPNVSMADLCDAAARMTEYHVGESDESFEHIKADAERLSGSHRVSMTLSLFPPSTAAEALAGATISFTSSLDDFAIAMKDVAASIGKQIMADMVKLAAANNPPPWAGGAALQPHGFWVGSPGYVPLSVPLNSQQGPGEWWPTTAPPKATSPAKQAEVSFA